MMAFALPLAMIATAIGTGVSAYGQYQQGQAASAAANYQAGVGNILAGALETRGATQIAEAGIPMQQAGIRGAADVGRANVRAGAGGVAIGGGSTAQVVGSIRAGSMENEKIAQYNAQQAAYQERLTASEKRAGAGLYGMAAQEDITAGEIGAVGTGLAGIGKVAGMGYEGYGTVPDPSLAGSQQSVAPKWYQ
jgi:hypothetical protein